MCQSPSGRETGLRGFSRYTAPALLAFLLYSVGPQP
jgi:hypothetical protein